MHWCFSTKIGNGLFDRVLARIMASLNPDLLLSWNPFRQRHRKFFPVLHLKRLLYWLHLIYHFPNSSLSFTRTSAIENPAFDDINNQIPMYKNPPSQEPRPDAPYVATTQRYNNGQSLSVPPGMIQFSTNNCFYQTYGMKQKTSSS